MITKVSEFDFRLFDYAFWLLDSNPDSEFYILLLEDDYSE